MIWLLLHDVAHAAEEAADFSLLGIWNHSGLIARIVIVTLIIMFFGTCIVSVERIIAFMRSRGHSVKVALAVVKPMQAYDVQGALAVVKRDDFRAGHLTSLLRAGLAEIAERPNATGIHNAERAIDKKVGEQIAKLKRWFGIMASVGSTAPFVGLAGTTMGVINAFQGMASSEGAGLAGISAGISEALITTFIGIVVAIWGVWCFNFFNGWVEKVTDELITARADFLNWAEKLVADGGVSPYGADEPATEDAAPMDPAPVAGK